MTQWLLGLGPPAIAAGLALLPGRRLDWSRPLHLLALASAGFIVLASLMPEAYRALGWPALAVFVLALGVPTLSERLLRRYHATTGLAGVVLTVHQLIDGLQMGALGDSLGPAAITALGLHGAPLVFAGVVTVDLREGRPRAIPLALALIGATALGILLGGIVDPEALHPAEPWLKAVVSGLLLHVVLHNHPKEEEHAHDHAH